MAKHIEDVKTAELPLPDVSRKRGRPSTGRALTSAERQRRRRARDRELLHLNDRDYQLILAGLTLEGLAFEIAKAARGGYTSLVKACADEFIARSSKNCDSHEKVKS